MTVKKMLNDLNNKGTPSSQCSLGELRSDRFENSETRCEERLKELTCDLSPQQIFHFLPFSSGN